MSTSVCVWGGDIPKYNLVHRNDPTPSWASAHLMAHCEVIVSLWLASCNKQTGVYLLWNATLTSHWNRSFSFYFLLLWFFTFTMFIFNLPLFPDSKLFSCFDILSSITFIFILFYYFSLKSPWQGFTCCHSLPCIIKTVDLKSNFIDRNKLILNSSASDSYTSRKERTVLKDTSMLLSTTV